MRHWLTATLLTVASAGSTQDVPREAQSAAPASATALPDKPLMCGGGAPSAPAAPAAQLLAGYGSGGFAITTANPRAQAFFDNGMQLGAAFAHQDAIAAFKEAVKLDPACAMCLWGEAWSSGPTINYPIERGEADAQGAKVVRAEALAAASGTDLERALIAALKLRYAKGNMDKANLAFARAMDALAVAHPQDKGIATLAADAWLVAGWGKPHVTRAIALLEGALAGDPDYTPAIHFYIHATEGAGEPAKATPYADRLGRLAPRASHLVHMPSHTYYWIGRYQDAADANVRAVALGMDDARRMGKPMPQGVWDVPYHAHNVHFGIGGAMMAGDAKAALSLSGPLVAGAAGRDKAGLFSQMVAGMGYFAEGRFGETGAVLALPEPKLPFMQAYWHYARGQARARMGDAAGVRAEAAAIPWTVREKGAGGRRRGRDLAGAAVRLARIGRLVLEGQAAMIEKQPAAALASFAKATAMQEEKRVMDFADPPIWWYPVRRSMAEAKLAMGDATGALAEAEATLKMRPADPVTLALRAQAKAALGQAASARADRALAMRLWRGDKRALGAV